MVPTCSAFPLPLRRESASAPAPTSANPSFWGKRRVSRFASSRDGVPPSSPDDDGAIEVYVNSAKHRGRARPRANLASTRSNDESSARKSSFKVVPIDDDECAGRFVEHPRRFAPPARKAPGSAPTSAGLARRAEREASRGRRRPIAMPPVPGGPRPPTWPVKLAGRSWTSAKPSTAYGIVPVRSAAESTRPRSSRTAAFARAVMACGEARRATRLAWLGRCRPSRLRTARRGRSRGRRRCRRG